jgi:hypothetical protein
MDAIRQGAGSPDLSDVRSASEQACAAWREARSDLASILGVYLAQRSDALLEDLKRQAEEMTQLTRPKRSVFKVRRVLEREGFIEPS